MKVYVEPELEFIMLTGAVICTSNNIEDNTEVGDPTNKGNTSVSGDELFSGGQ